MSEERWMCRLCGRDKLSRPNQPHRCCSGGVTKNWKKIAKMRNIVGPTFVKVS